MINIHLKIKNIYWILLPLFLFAGLTPAYGSTSAGYSEYYVPGNEENMLRIFEEVGAGSQGNTTHAIISVTAWSDNTTVYYDHWEDGYDFDPGDPATADETYALAKRGDSHVFESSNIPANPRGTAIYYDGGDHIYVAGGATTVVRASWTETAGPNQSLAWELYPVKPQLTTYILPFGEDLAANNPPNLQDFNRVFALIQATSDGTDVTVDIDGDGVAETLDQNRDGDCTDPSDTDTVSLNAGEVFLLDDDCLCAPYTMINTGTVITGSKTLQVQYVIGDEGTNYEIRGLSAFPRGFWDDEYYAPVDSAAAARGAPTDIYLHNPHSSTLTVDYETTTNSGSFTIPARETVSFSSETGGYVPEDSAVYFKGNDVFWGVSTIDAENQVYDWGYSLVPAFLLQNEHFMGWAPCSYPLNMANVDDSGIFIAPAQDNIQVYVDLDNDGAADQTFDMNRLETQYVYDSSDGDMSNANIWATGPYTIAYGENPNTAATSNPALDLGYTTLPGVGFIDKVLKVIKSTDPVFVSTATGSQATYTLEVNSYSFSVDDIIVTDILPSGWKYVDGSTTITLADQTQLTGSSSDPQFISYRDSFDSTVYNNNGDNLPSGTNWTTNWNEESDDDLATGGEARIVTDTAVTPNESVLRITDNDVAIARMADLSGYSGAVLSFYYRRYLLDAANEYVDCEVCADAVNGTDITCTSGWTQVARIAGPTNDSEYQQYTVDLTKVLANPNTNAFAVRFTSNGIGSIDAGDYIYFDNVQIQTPVTWSSTTLGDMDENQQITITFTAETTQDFNAGDITRNVVKAQGTRTVGAATQTFITSDFVFNSFGDIEVSKTSSGVDPLYPGDQFTYTITVTNPATASANLTDIAVFDSLPDGVSYVPDSSYIDVSGVTTDTYSYDFESGDQGFTVGAAGGTPSMNWERGDPETISPPDTGKCAASCYGGGPDDDHTSSGVSCWGTDLDDLYSNNITAIYLYSPVYDFSSRSYVELSFWEWLEIEGNTYDYARLQRNVNGAGWVDAWVYGDTEATRVDTSWSQFVHDASSYAANQSQVQWRWMIQTDGSWQWGGWYIDDVVVTASTGTGPGDGPGGDPPNFVNADDGYVLPPGESLTLTFDVTVDDPLATGIDEITNTASVTTSQYLLPAAASITNIVVNPTTASCEVGDRVWLDTDGDGVLDIGESGLSNVEVTLKDQFGTPIDTDITDSTGHYLFTDIEPGNDYYIEITAGLPVGLTQTAPSGHSDDRTDPFDLTAGQNYLDADLGYAPAAGTATIGGLLWSDADGDGIRDAGEPGLEGITVELWLDVDDDGIFEPSGDDVQTPVSTTTAAGGSYLFTGITASGSENYFVYVDSTQTALSDYTATTVTLYEFTDIDAGDVELNKNMGFQNTSGTAYSIKDRVWFDINEDAEDDGEDGISGITVDLLDNSMYVIASTVTDADGYFIFNGVPGEGADYTLKITDTSGILDDYYGITAGAIANLKDINNLTGNLDYTVEPTEPGFGYSLSKTVGGTVFNDIDADGTQNSGEPGIGGVDVELWMDVDDDGIYEPAGDDFQTAESIVTDSNGNYMFSGLADGTYFVHIDNTQTVLSGYDTLTTGDDETSAGHQLQVSIAGGSNAINTNFGYHATTSYSISGMIWEDKDSNGVIDGTEPGIENVTVKLYQDDGDSSYGSGDTLVASVVTNSSGIYSFSSFPADQYIIVVTDDNSILTGYDTTYEKTEGVTSPFNYWEYMDLTADVTDAHFGYNNPTSTFVLISTFRAYNDGSGRVVVEWRTASEIGTIGFYLYRKDDAMGEYMRLNDMLLPGLLVSPQGGTYSYVDSTAVPDRSYRYKLEEVEVKGKRQMYGPFDVTAGGVEINFLHEKTDKYILDRQATRLTGNREDFSGYSRKANDRVVKRTMNSLNVYETYQSSADSSDALCSGSTDFSAKVTIVDSGIYYLSAADIATALDISSDNAEKLIKGGLADVRNRSNSVAYTGTDNGSGLYFYGEALDDIYTKQNIYWLNEGSGVQMETVNGGSPEPVSADETFEDTIHLEEDHWALTNVCDDPASDYWAWDYVFGGYSGLDTKSFTFNASGLAVSAAQAHLTVRLQAAADTSDSSDNHVVIGINGTEVINEYWDGTAPVTFDASFNQSLLADGSNTITVKGLLDTGAPYSIFYIDSFDMTYSRYYRAEDNRLLVRGDGNSVITIYGFTNADIMVFDVTDPAKPQIVDGTTIREETGDYTVSFYPTDPVAGYFAVTRDKINLPVSFATDNPSCLKETDNRADYIIITPSGLKNAAQSLADYRQAQGYPSMVVELENIIDEFNDGLYSPEAIRDFLSYAYHYWGGAPKYIVLAGEGTYDYKNNQGYGDNFVPPLMVKTPAGLFASDNRLADVEGNDGVPEMAIGRLPVVSADELYMVIDKIKAYEGSGGGEWTENVLVVADDPDEGGNFPVDSDDISEIVPKGYLVRHVYLFEHTLNEARQLLIDDINNGSSLLNYIGHGAVDRFAQEGMLVSGDMSLLNNAEKLPVVTAMTCVVGQYAIPGYDSLSEMLVLHENGGAIAVWSPTGLSSNEQAKMLDEGFLRSTFNQKPGLLGDVVLDTLKEYGSQGGDVYMLDVYNLLGDPALHIWQKPVAADSIPDEAGDSDVADAGSSNGSGGSCFIRQLYDDKQQGYCTFMSHLRNWLKPDKKR